MNNILSAIISLVEIAIGNQVEARHIQMNLSLWLFGNVKNMYVLINVMCYQCFWEY